MSSKQILTKVAKSSVIELQTRLSWHKAKHHATCVHDDVKMLQAQLREQTYCAISTETERVVYKFWEVVQLFN